MPTAPEASQDMPRILIIDDDPAIRQSAELVLCTLGFETDTADNGAAGLNRMWDLPPDLVICDLVMPGLDGFEVLASARQDARLARIPFLFLVSPTEDEIQRKGLPSGASDFLTKPFHPTELVDAIQGCFRKIVSPRPDSTATEAALSHARDLLGGQQEGVLDLPGQEPLTPEPSLLPPVADPRGARPRIHHWIGRIRHLFDENNPEGILYCQDIIIAKKLTIHATTLLAALHFKEGRLAEAEAEFAIADSMLKQNAERFRLAARTEGARRKPVAYAGLLGKILRLERKLAALRKVLSD